SCSNLQLQGVPLLANDRAAWTTQRNDRGFLPGPRWTAVPTVAGRAPHRQQFGIDLAPHFRDGAPDMGAVVVIGAHRRSCVAGWCTTAVPAGYRAASAIVSRVAATDLRRVAGSPAHLAHRARVLGPRAGAK